MVAAAMLTAILISLGLGAFAGAGLGWKLGRSYERMRPKTKGTKEKKRRTA